MNAAWSAEPTTESVKAKVEALVAQVNPSDYEPIIRKVSDDLYDRLLGTVQDYLADNIDYNLRADFDFAAYRARSYEQELIAVDKLLTPFGGKEERMRRIDELLAKEIELYALRASQEAAK